MRTAVRLGASPRGALSQPSASQAAGAFVEEAHRRGLYMLPSGPNAVRAVFYLDIRQADLETPLSIIDDVLEELPPVGASRFGDATATSSNY
jgi:threonine aldolase